MSTGLECMFIEIKPGEWYYILETWDSPKGGWDWREYAEAYGPFPTEEAAAKHLDENHANPGGSWTQEFDAAYKPDQVMQDLIAKAEKPRVNARWSW